jgi:hypothetical protein
VTLPVVSNAVQINKKKIGIKAFGFAAVLCLSFAHNVSAESITYTEQTIGSGSLDGTAFSNALITIALSGDTTTVQNKGGGLFYDFGSATVTVAGIGSDSLSGAAQANIFSNNPVGAAGISELGNDILDIYSSSFNSYALANAIGPITGSPNYIPGESVAATKGNFVLTSAGQSTFTATTGAPPAMASEPNTNFLLSPLLALLAIFGLRRKQQT